MDRFWSKVDMNPHHCWEWQAAVGADGYGTFRLEGKMHRAHRLAYRVAVGPISPGLVLDHLCRNTTCVRPDHLEPVTQAENIRRGKSPSAANATKTHCKRGHEFTEENTYVKRDGRQCRECQRMHDRNRNPRY